MAYETGTQQAEEPKPKPLKPLNGERAFADTDYSKHQKIVEYVTSCKTEYFRDERYTKYMARIAKMQRLINQEWGEDRSTRFGMRHALMRASYDNYNDSLNDLFSVPDLMFYKADDGKSEQIASDMQLYTNRLLRSIGYHKHLSRRCSWIPDYGWSIAHDSYLFNEGWITRMQSGASESAIPGLSSMKFGKEWDVYQDRPNPDIVTPAQWFGSASHSDDQPYQGCIKRWYLRDILAAMKRTTADGKPLYNLEALEKLKTAMIRGESKKDEFAEDQQNNIVMKINWENKKAGPCVDITRFYGPLNEISDAELAEDVNEYYIECADGCLLLWMENPRDRFTMFTHGRSHPFRDTPFSRSFLDAVTPHQQFTDFLTNMSMESIVDKLTVHWGIYEEDMIDPDEFYNPKGLNSFLHMTGKGRMPQMIGGERSGAFADVKDVLTLLDRDRQRAGATDQEMGALGKSQDQTATAARILATASSKKIRAMVKNFCRDAVVPQVKNLVMLSLVHGKEEVRKFISGGKNIQITDEHIKFFLSDVPMEVTDSITVDRNEEAMKATAFLNYAGQILPNLIDPSAIIHVLRWSAKMNGLPMHIVDKAMPEPMPVDANAPKPAAPMLPPGAQPPAMKPPAAMTMPLGVNVNEGNPNASMVAPQA